MYYSSIGLLAAIILLTENQDILLHTSDSFDKPAWKAYRRFLIAVLAYYATDILWGVLESRKAVGPLFVDTSLYFVAMAAGVALWTRYLVTYLDESGAFVRFLQNAGLAIAVLTGLVSLANVFHPILFVVDEACVYHPFGIRTVILASQVVLLILVSVYALGAIMRKRLTTDERKRYRTLALFGLIVGVCQIAQLLYVYLPMYAVGYLLGVSLIRAVVIGDEKERYRHELAEATKIVELRQSVEQAQAAYRQAVSTSSVYEDIVEALSGDYFNLFYIDLESDDFIEYGSRTKVGLQGTEKHGKDFFTATKNNAQSLIYEEDREAFVRAIDKEALLDEVDRNGMAIMQYRLLIDGKPTYVNLKATRAKGDERHLIVGINNIDAQVRDRAAALRAQEERKSYLRLSALNGNLIVLYYVDLLNDHYTEYGATEDYDRLGIAKQGDEFFQTTYENSLRTVHPDDLELFHSQITKDNILGAIDRDGTFALDYRLINGDREIYIKFKAARIEEDGRPLLIIGLLDEDARVRREQAYAHDLSAARRMASVDALTGVKNKHAYAQWERRIDDGIAAGEQEPFAVVVCDINNLKEANDLYGHREGDLCIKRACRRICDAFEHSPVFRVGGDEFVALVTGRDYERRRELLEQVNELPEDRGAVRAGDTISAGMVDYDQARHSSLLSVFEEADKAMYERKQLVRSLLRPQRV